MRFSDEFRLHRETNFYGVYYANSFGFPVDHLFMKFWNFNQNQPIKPRVTKIDMVVAYDQVIILDIHWTLTGDLKSAY